MSNNNPALVNNASELGQEYYNMSQAAIYVGLTVSTLYKLTSKKVISFYKPGGKVILFKKTDLDEWIEKSRISSQSENDTKAKSHLQSLSERKKR